MKYITMTIRTNGFHARRIEKWTRITLSGKFPFVKIKRGFQHQPSQSTENTIKLVKEFMRSESNGKD